MKFILIYGDQTLYILKFKYKEATKRSINNDNMINKHLSLLLLILLGIMITMMANRGLVARLIFEM